MFEKEHKIKAEDAETVIGAGVRVEGNFNAFGDVIVKGTVSGALETQNDLHVEAGALIEADAKAKNAYIAGEIKGGLIAEEKIKFSRSAKIEGDIQCKILSVEEGAVINGRCIMGAKPVNEKE